MAGLGNPLSAPLGGGPTAVEEEYQALLDAYAPDINPLDPSNQAQAWAEAILLANIWAANERLAGQLVPPRMMDDMVTWETACALVPPPGSTDVARRGAVAAQFLGYLSNAWPAINDIVTALDGRNFLGFGEPLRLVYYAPGINFGPPGFEWSGNRPCYAVRLTRTGTVASTFLDLVRRIKLQLSKVVPGWNVYAVGTYDTPAPAAAVPPGWDPAWDGATGAPGFTPGVSMIGIGLL